MVASMQTMASCAAITSKTAPFVLGAQSCGPLISNELWVVAPKGAPNQCEKRKPEPTLKGAADAEDAGEIPNPPNPP